MRYRIAKLRDLPPEGQGKSFDVAGTHVALFRRGPRVYALRDRCPHAGAPLSIGHLTGQELMCAWHGWTFDVTTGESLPHHPPFDVQTFAVTIEGEDVVIAVPDPS